MDHRNGQCTRCSASFKIPPTFTAHQARCRECGGTVRIERMPAAPRAREATRRADAPVAGPVLDARPAVDARPAAPTPEPMPERIVAEPPAKTPRATPRAEPAANEPVRVRQPVARTGRRLAWALAAAIVVAVSLWMLSQQSADAVEAAPSASSPPVTPHDARGE
ncbi:MAG: hypothetical protein ACKVWV_18290 [Planctomycetota bacterium]